MAIKNVEIQDDTGNIYYTHTESSVVKHGDTTVSTVLSDMDYETAGGSAAVITLTMQTLRNGYAKTFIASANNGGVDTTINGKPLYKPGTTKAPNLISGKAYTVWYNSTGDCFFIRASAEGNTIESHVLAGDTFSTALETGLTGSMTNNGAATITPGTANIPIPLGYHNGNGYVLGDSDLVSANIKSGINIFGVSGKASVVDTSDAYASAGDMISGNTAYVNGIKINGTLQDVLGRTNAVNATLVDNGNNLCYWVNKGAYRTAGNYGYPNVLYPVPYVLSTLGASLIYSVTTSNTNASTPTLVTLPFTPGLFFVMSNNTKDIWVYYNTTKLSGARNSGSVIYLNFGNSTLSASSTYVTYNSSTHVISLLASTVNDTYTVYAIN